jgi:hypothetical protein
MVEERLYQLVCAFSDLFFGPVYYCLGESKLYSSSESYGRALAKQSGFKEG